MRSKPTFFLAAVASLAIASGALAWPGENLASQARVTMTQASAIAVKARPGKITDRELEREKGGSGLRYSFDVQANGITYEVGIDAVTGRVLENGREGKNPD
jgi:uncharacterized membrane protein YkoI